MRRLVVLLALISLFSAPSAFAAKAPSRAPQPARAPRLTPKEQAAARRAKVLVKRGEALTKEIAQDRARHASEQAIKAKVAARAAVIKELKQLAKDNPRLARMAQEKLAARRKAHAGMERRGSKVTAVTPGGVAAPRASH